MRFVIHNGRVSPAKVVGDVVTRERRWYDAGRKACVGGKQCEDYLYIVSPVGCGVAACASGKTVVVCEYYPF
uniref:SCP domain-containing protein n=1 Tax=Leersia perrieri TaxID=77586 RepID=A0A0D9W385_9ORYZ